MKYSESLFILLHSVALKMEVEECIMEYIFPFSMFCLYTASENDCAESTYCLMLKLNEYII